MLGAVNHSTDDLLYRTLDAAVVTALLIPSRGKSPGGFRGPVSTGVGVAGDLGS
jgi:hypothetical protein